MTADLARSLTNTVLQHQSQVTAPTLKAIYEHIKVAAKMGASATRFAVPYSVHDNVITTVAKQLEENGFTVNFEQTANRERGLIIVTW